jgi:hypothetical protein
MSGFGRYESEDHVMIRLQMHGPGHPALGLVGWFGAIPINSRLGGKLILVLEVVPTAASSSLSKSVFEKCIPGMALASFIRCRFDWEADTTGR